MINKNIIDLVVTATSNEHFNYEFSDEEYQKLVAISNKYSNKFPYYKDIFDNLHNASIIRSPGTKEFNENLEELKKDKEDFSYVKDLTIQDFANHKCILGANAALYLHIDDKCLYAHYPLVTSYNRTYPTLKPNYNRIFSEDYNPPQTFTPELLVDGDDSHSDNETELGAKLLKEDAEKFAYGVNTKEYFLIDLLALNLYHNNPQFQAMIDNPDRAALIYIYEGPDDHKIFKVISVALDDSTIQGEQLEDYNRKIDEFIARCKLPYIISSIILSYVNAFDFSTDNPQEFYQDNLSKTLKLVRASLSKNKSIEEAIYNAANDLVKDPADDEIIFFVGRRFPDTIFSQSLDPIVFEQVQKVCREKYTGIAKTVFNNMFKQQTNKELVFPTTKTKDALSQIFPLYFNLENTALINVILPVYIESVEEVHSSEGITTRIANFVTYKGIDLPSGFEKVRNSFTIVLDENNPLYQYLDEDRFAILDFDLTKANSSINNISNNANPALRNLTLFEDKDVALKTFAYDATFGGVQNTIDLALNYNNDNINQFPEDRSNTQAYNSLGSVRDIYYNDISNRWYYTFLANRGRSNFRFIRDIDLARVVRSFSRHARLERGVDANASQDEKMRNIFYKGIARLGKEGKEFKISPYGGSNDSIIFGKDYIKFGDQVLTCSNFSVTTPSLLLNKFNQNRLKEHRISGLYKQLQEVNQGETLDRRFSTSRYFAYNKKDGHVDTIIEKYGLKRNYINNLPMPFTSMFINHNGNPNLIGRSTRTGTNSLPFRYEICASVLELCRNNYGLDARAAVHELPNTDYNIETNSIQSSNHISTCRELEFEELVTRFVDCILRPYIHKDNTTSIKTLTEIYWNNEEEQEVFKLLNGTIGTVNFDLEVRKKIGARGTVQSFYLNNTRVRKDEISDILKKAICFDAQEDYDKFILEVSKISLTARELMHNGIKILLNSTTSNPVTIVLEFERSHSSWYLLLRDQNDKIKSKCKITGGITKFTNLYKKQKASASEAVHLYAKELCDLLDKIEDLSIQDVTHLMTIGSFVVNQREARSRKLLEDTVKIVKAEYKELSYGNKRERGYVVTGNSGQEYLISCQLGTKVNNRNNHGDKWGTVFALPTLRYICIVDKSMNDQSGYDIVVNRLFALKNDSQIVREVSTLQTYVNNPNAQE